MIPSRSAAINAPDRAVAHTMLRLVRLTCLHHSFLGFICAIRSLLERAGFACGGRAVRSLFAVQGLLFMRKIVLAAAVAGAALTLAACSSKPAEEASTEAPAMADTSAATDTAAPAADATATDAAATDDAAAPADAGSGDASSD